MIPPDHKWFTRIATGAVIVHTLIEIDPRYPTLDAETDRALEQAKCELEAEVSR